MKIDVEQKVILSLSAKEALCLERILQSAEIASHTPDTINLTEEQTIVMDNLIKLFASGLRYDFK